jgi:hypothetical protein
MGDWKEELRTLVERNKQRKQEVEDSVQETINGLRRSREEVDAFIENEVLPTLEEIRAELEPHYKDIRIESVHSGVVMTMASGAKLAGERKYTNEVQYKVEVNMFKRTAEGVLLLLNVVPGSTGEKDFLVGRLEVSSSGDGQDGFAITQEDIRSNFLQLYSGYVN